MTAEPTTETPAKGLAGYRTVLQIPEVRYTVILGTLCKIPTFAMSVLFTLHLVQNVTPSYQRAGLVVAVITIAMSISAPWRGAVLDRRGLRRTMIPSIIVLAPLYVLLACVNNYWLVIPVAALCGLMNFPVFSVIRQVLIGNTPVPLRKTVVALDSTITELCFMVGPAVAIWIATAWNTRWTLLASAELAVVAAIVLTIYNPSTEDRLGDPAAIDVTEHVSSRSWMTPRVFAILLAAVGTGFVLAGTDLSVVASLRDMGRSDLIGVILVFWSISSAIMGLVYGSMSHPISASWMLLGLGLTTIPAMFAPNPWVLGITLLVAGIFCAPTLVAIVDELQAVVPARFRGQAMGWQGTAMTIGNAMAPPLVGAVMDVWSWRYGFMLSGALGVVGAVILLVSTQLRRARRRRRSQRLAHGTSV